MQKPTRNRKDKIGISLENNDLWLIRSIGKKLVYLLTNTKVSLLALTKYNKKVYLNRRKRFLNTFIKFKTCHGFN